MDSQDIVKYAAMVYHEGDMADDSIEQPGFPELQSPGSEQLESPADRFRKNGATIAIRSMVEELSQPLSVVIGYSELHTQLGQPLNTQAITGGISAIAAILEKYRKAANTGQFSFTKYSGEKVLSVHAHAEPLPTSTIPDPNQSPTSS